MGQPCEFYLLARGALTVGTPASITAAAALGPSTTPIAAEARALCTARAGNHRLGLLSAARPYKSAIQNGFAMENAKGT